MTGPARGLEARGLLRVAASALLAAWLLLGIAHIALLPPWEGFDERAHYSYIQQIAETWSLPRWGVARLSTDVERYSDLAPLRYSTRPPMERYSTYTYKSFFESPPETVARGRAEVHAPPLTPRRFSPGESLSGQAQHPALYYVVLAPFYLATRHLSWASQLLVLRSVSYLLAWLALLLAIRGCLAEARAAGPAGAGLPWEWAALGIAVWPALLPAWFPEMARLGNDSLCALLMALVWLVTVRAVRAGLSLGRALALGALLGLGAVTKAFFVPIAAGVCAFWLFREWQSRGRITSRLLGHVAVVVASVVAIAGWWYLANWLRYGVPLGANELIVLRESGGLLAGLGERFSVWAWLRGHAAYLTTAAWSGTWSFARPPAAFLAPMALLVVAGAAAYLSALPRLRHIVVALLPLWLAGPVALGLSYHVLVRIALTGEGRGTGGYYLHFLVAPLGAALGLGLGAWYGRRLVRALAAAFALYALGFAVAVSWAQVMLFSGWLFKAGASRLYQSPPELPPLLGIPAALDRLEALAFPGLGTVAWALGAALGAIGAWLAYRAARALPPLRG